MAAGHRAAADNPFTSALDMQGGGGVNVPLIIFFEFVFFVVLLCIVLRSICPSPPLEAGD